MAALTAFSHAHSHTHSLCLSVCLSVCMLVHTVIMLRTLNMTPGEVRQAVVALDEFLMPRQALDQLLKFVPTEEEV
jgi:hypothetical protein